MLQIYAGRITQKNRVKQNTEAECMYIVHTQKGHSPKTEMEQVGQQEQNLEKQRKGAEQEWKETEGIRERAEKQQKGTR